MSPSPEDATQRPNEKDGQEFTPAVAFAMGEIKGSVENLRTDLKEWKEDVKSTVATNREAADKKITDLETRVRSLESWFWKVSGAVTVIAFLANKIFDWVSKHV